MLKRLANARGEMEAMKEGGLFDFVVTNSDLDRATTSLAALVSWPYCDDRGPPSRPRTCFDRLPRSRR